MSSKIYIGNISYNAQENDIAELFGQYGEVVSVRIIIDRYTNQSKGFGFVEMAEGSAAEAAISELNGKEWQNRELRVNVARERNERPAYNNNY